MLITVLTTLVVAVGIIYLFYKFIFWSMDYKAQGDFDEEVRNSALYNVVLPDYMGDSGKYANFWGNYYYIKYT